MERNTSSHRVRRAVAVLGAVATLNVLVGPVFARDGAPTVARVGASIFAQVSDVPIVSVVASDPTATEVGPTTGVFTFTRTGGVDATLDVSYTVGGTATAGSDYVALSGTATFPVGASSVTVAVTPIDDDIDEPDETVTLTLAAGAGYVIGASPSATVAIIADDDEPLPEVSVAASDPTATEAGPTTGVFTFTRTGGVDATLDVSYTVGGTATAGSDYVVLSGTATFPVGASSVTVAVTPIDDDIEEPDETVTLTLAADDAYVLDSTTSASVTIHDDDEEMPVSTGDTNLIVVSDNDQVLQLACDGRAVEVTGNHNTLVLTGTCSRLTVRGNGNSITLATATTVHDTGNENQVVMPAAPTPPAPEPPSSAGPIVVSDNDQVLQLACDGRAVEVTGNHNTLVLTGTCSRLTVRGNGNSIALPASTPVTDTGNENIIG